MDIFKVLKSTNKNKPSYWFDFAKLINGDYSYINHEKVSFHYKNYTITIDEYTHYAVVNTKAYEQKYIRGLAQLPKNEDLSFKLTSQGILENIRKLFGAKEIIIGDKQFDKLYLIEGNSEHAIQLFFSYIAAWIK